MPTPTLPQHRLNILVAWALAFWLPGATASAWGTPPQAQRETASTWLPSDPAKWVNSPPITGEMLKGKSALLFFFEEISPQARGRWSSLAALSKKHAGEPIVFIAVNSGESAAKVAQYAVKNKVALPIIVDSDRSLERRLGVRPLNSENATQVRLIRHDGTFAGGNPNNLAGSATQALSGARWELDGNEIADQHKLAWRLVEFKLFAPAAEMIRGDLNAPRDDVRSSAERLHAFVQQHLATEAKSAKSLLDQDKTFESFVAFRALQQRFAGYEIPEKFQRVMEQLDRDPELKAELKAQELLAETRVLIASGDPRALRQAKARLNNIVRRYPNTMAAAEASKLLSGN